MAIALLTFVISLLITFGAYWLLVLRPEQSGRAATLGRFQGAASGMTSAGVVRDSEAVSEVPFLDRLLRRRQAFAGPFEQLLAESGVRMTVGACVVLTG
ncbi:MAG: hypothetical protein OEW19_11025, partial [Acidobacteriota bacterium]|nr:hypothetical protein [Acidobacteriota bacterium]